MKKELLIIRVDSELKKEFEKYAKKEFKNMSEIMRDFMYKWIIKKRKENN